VILLGIGANLPSEAHGPPRATCGAALDQLEKIGVSIIKRAPWYRSAPVPMSDQPWYVNGVVRIETASAAQQLMDLLLQAEARLGRQRGERNAPRIVDLDILAYGDQVIDADGLILPHPRMHERAFVITPLSDIEPGWRHPVSGKNASEILAELPPDQQTERMPDAAGRHGTEWLA